MTSVFDKIKNLLDENEIEYKVKHHGETRTSEQSAKARGDSIKQGAKAMIIRTEKGFVLCVLSAEKKIDSKKLRLVLNVKKTDFASTENLKELGLEKGAVPPFGSILGLKTYVDRSLLENEEISFNAGSLTDSIKMSLKNYLKSENPKIEDFS